MTIADTTRGAVRRDGGAVSETAAGFDIDAAVGRLLSPAEAAEPDPIYALIDEHRSAYAAWARLDGVENSFSPDDPAGAAAREAALEADRRRAELEEMLVEARPTTPAGLLALVEHLPDALRATEFEAEQPAGERALRAVAETLREFGRVGLPDRGLTAVMLHRRKNAEAWLQEMRQEGYVPFPADHPRTLMAIDLAIPLEAKRLLKIAQGEFDRGAAAYASLLPAERDAHLARLRAEYRLDELAAVVSGTPVGLAQGGA